MMKRTLSYLLSALLFSSLAAARNQSSPSQQPKPKSENQKLKDFYKSFMGQWTGKAAGMEVRFKREGIMTLTVKHEADFFFAVDAAGHVDGEGTIFFDLDTDLRGVDALARDVQQMIGMIPSPSKTPAAIDNIRKASPLDLPKAPAPRGTKLSYSYELKGGKQMRKFTFSGHVELPAIWNGEMDQAHLVLEKTGDFKNVADAADNDLFVVYQVNGSGDTKAFSCWSPFLANGGAVRKGPGGFYVVEFNESGSHRNDTKVWQEYNYAWTARQAK